MMRRGKRERLEAKSWRFGSAQEFLGLSNEENVVVLGPRCLSSPGALRAR
jgi:hypothetical protein